MTTMGPRRVSVSSLWSWVAEGVDLATRRVWLNVPTCMLFMVIWIVLPAQVGSLAIEWLTPVYLATFAIVARSTDTRVPVIQSARTAGPGFFKVAMFSVGCLTIQTLTSHVGVKGQEISWAVFSGATNAIGNLFSARVADVNISIIRILFAYCALAVGRMMASVGNPIAWFGIPVLALSGVPFFPALGLAFRASMKNVPVCLLVAVISTVLAFFAMAIARLALFEFRIALLGGFACLFLFPVTGATLYACYRDVFLGIPRSKAVQSLKTRGVTPAAAQVR